jgi:hypothetical protein
MLLNVFGPKNCHLGRLPPGMVQEFEPGIMVVAADESHPWLMN